MPAAGLVVLSHCSIYDSSLLTGGGGLGAGADAGGATAGSSSGNSGGGGSSGATTAGVAGTEASTAGTPSGAAGEAGAGPVGPSCSDGELNGDETEIDCGGSCESACPEKLCSELVPEPTLESVVAGASLVGWYRFHDGLSLGTDSSEAANDAGVVDGVTQASDVERGCVAVFKGTSALVFPVSVTQDMSLSLWLQTDIAGLGEAGTDWYGGSSLLNAERPGMVNDFGLTLLADEIAFGVGNPDLTLHGGQGVNDNVWHHVVATRADGSGELVLYLDKVEQSRQTGATGARDAATAIGVGWNHLVGRVADIRIYDAVLSKAEVDQIFAGN